MHQIERWDLMCVRNAVATVALCCCFVLGGEGVCRAGESWVKAGLLYRGGMNARSTGTSYTQDQDLHGAEPVGGLDLPDVGKNPDNINSYANRDFDDGYVYMDAGTGNPASIDPTVTWFWGYQDRDQLDTGADTLTFTRTTVSSKNRPFEGQGRRVVLDALKDTSATFDDDFGGFGAEIVWGFPTDTEGNVRVDFCAGLGVIISENATVGGTSFHEEIRDETFTASGQHRYTDTITDTYVYDVSGVSIPGAPHSGTYDGPFDTPPVIPSPTIPNRPSDVYRDASRDSNFDVASETIIASTVWNAMNRITMDVDTDIYQAWLGSQLTFNGGESLSFNVTPRVSMNFVDVSVERSEQFSVTYADGGREVLNSWSDSGSESWFFFGAGVTAGANLELKNGIFAGIWGGYEWLSDKIDVEVGPNTVSVDASGYTAGVVLGRRFGG